MVFNPTIKTGQTKNIKSFYSEPRITQNDLTEDNYFVEIEVVTPKLNDTERREVQLE